MALNIDMSDRFWTTTMRLGKHEVLALLAVLDNPPAGCDIETLDHLQLRLERLVMRKNPASSELSLSEDG